MRDNHKPKSIDKNGKLGLTIEKKGILKQQQGSASVAIDLNTMREWVKYGEEHDESSMNYHRRCCDDRIMG